MKLRSRFLVLLLIVCLLSIPVATFFGWFYAIYAIPAGTWWKIPAMITAALAGLVISLVALLLVGGMCKGIKEVQAKRKREEFFKQQGRKE